MRKKVIVFAAALFLITGIAYIYQSINRDYPVAQIQAMKHEPEAAAADKAGWYIISEELYDKAGCRNETDAWEIVAQYLLRSKILHYKSELRSGNDLFLRTQEEDLVIQDRHYYVVEFSLYHPASSSYEDAYLIERFYVEQKTGELYQEQDKNPEYMEYVDQAWHVALKYPGKWEINRQFRGRYEGEDGFFSCSAACNADGTIDKVVEYYACHKMQPYGSKPQIIKSEVQGQEARLILPSDDQSKENKKLATLIIRYPKPVMGGREEWIFFELNADAEHIQSISDTLKFID